MPDPELASGPAGVTLGRPAAAGIAIVDAPPTAAFSIPGLCAILNPQILRIDGDTITFIGTNRRVTYRIVRWDPELAMLIGEIVATVETAMQ